MAIGSARVKQMLGRSTRRVRADGAKTINLMICGARRSGTTSLEYYLGEHPEIEFLSAPDLESIGGIPRGLPFNTPFTTISRGPESAGDYEATATRCAGRFKYIAWRAVYSMYFPHVIHNLAEQLPDLKIIFSFRNPVDTTYSVYCRQRTRGDDRSFEDAIKLGRSPLMPPPGVDPSTLPGWTRYYAGVPQMSSIVSRGFYYPYVRRFFDLFPRERIHAFSFTQLARDPVETLHGIERFLELDAHDFKRAGEVKSSSSKPGPIAPETRAALNEVFGESNRKLFELLGWPEDVWG